MPDCKYPHTPHLPNSPGRGRGDRVLSSDEHLKSYDELIITEKMDGENTTMTRDSIHARSLDSLDHPSRHVVKALWGRIRNDIPEGWRVCGENCYAQHSIHYSHLPSYFLVFNVWDPNNMCVSWDETIRLCRSLELTLAPVLARGPHRWLNFDHVWKVLMSDGDEHEGYVVRDSGCFSYDEFEYHVAKWVRPHHVQTDSFWLSKPIVKNELATQNEP